jgi:hypothetical protein
MDFALIRKGDFFFISTLVCMKNGFFFTNKNNKTRHFRIGFCFAPPIGESYNFSAMIAYSIIRKSMV